MDDLSDTLIDIKLCETSLIQRNTQIEQERRTAIRDLLSENYFHLPNRSEEKYQGPYALALRVEDDRMIFDIEDEKANKLEEFSFSLKPFKRVIKEYFIICESYYTALSGASPSKIEALDMGRRSIHNEGSELLKTRINTSVKTNLKTARRLFTLICVLHIR